MPIKFRCTHCRQLLGISRSKAGEVFDCPTCGRTLRVPRLDGTRAPVPAPALDLEDPSLRSALDELAMIGQSSVPDSDDEIDVTGIAAAPVMKTVGAPAPRPAPVPMEPPLPAEPVPASVHPVAGDSGVPVNPLAELAPLSHGDQSAPTTVRHSTSPAGRLVLASGLATTALLAFAAGFFFGRAGSPEHQGGAMTAGNADDVETPDANPSASDGDAVPAIRGRISYVSPAGRRPDRGARILVLPIAKPGDAKLTASIFRQDELSPDFRLARASLEALGGRVAIADDEGNFAVSLPQPGTYRILVLSHFQPRDAEEVIDSTLGQLLASWFDRPDQLLGRLAYQTGEVRYNGTRTEMWDHTFPAVL